MRACQGVKAFALWALFGVCFGETVEADGLPISEDRRHLRGDHTVFALTPEQMIEVGRFRLLTLSESQHSVLGWSIGLVPQVLRVHTCRHEDCTCGLGAIAVWCRNGEIDIPHDFLDRGVPRWASDMYLCLQEALRERADTTAIGEVLQGVLEEMEWALSYPVADTTGAFAELQDSTFVPSTEVTLIMDEDACCWYRGVEIRLPKAVELAHRLSQVAHEEGESAWVWVDVPPPQNSDVEVRIKGFVESLRISAREIGVEVHAYGFPDPAGE